MELPEKFFEVEFGKAMAFGYRTEDVDEFVNRAFEVVRGLQKENQELTEKMGVLAQSLEKYREEEESLRSAIIGAQKLGDSILKDSKSKAEVILREATTSADHIVEEAHAKLEREKAEYDRLRAEVAAFREGLFDLYKSHIDQISRLPHKERPTVQRSGEKERSVPGPGPTAAAVPAPVPAAVPEPQPEPEPVLEEMSIPDPPAPVNRRLPDPPPAPIPEEDEPEEVEVYTPAPIPDPPAPKRMPQRRPALRLELDDEEDEDDEMESDDEILSRFSARTSGRRSFRPLEDEYEDDDDDDMHPLARTVFSSKFGEMRFGEGFDLTQDNRDKDRGRDRGASGRTGNRRR